MGFWIETAASVILPVLEKTFDHTTRSISLQSLQNYIQAHFFNGRFFHFHTLLVLNAFHLFLFFHCYQIVPFFPLRSSMFGFYLLFFFLSCCSTFLFNYVHPTVPSWDQQRLHHSFFNILRSEKCHARFPGKKYNVLDFMRSVWEFPNGDDKEHVAMALYNALRSMELWVVPIFRCTDDAVFRE